MRYERWVESSSAQLSDIIKLIHWSAISNFERFSDLHKKTERLFSGLISSTMALLI